MGVKFYLKVYKRQNHNITSSKMAAERSEGHHFMGDFKRLLLPNRLSLGPRTLHAWYVKPDIASISKMAAVEK